MWCTAVSDARLCTAVRVDGSDGDVSEPWDSWSSQVWMHAGLGQAQDQNKNFIETRCQTRV